MKKFLLKVWNWAKGKKTATGMALMLINRGVQVFMPDLLASDQHAFINDVAAAIGAVGLTNKAVNTKVAAAIKKAAFNVNSKK